MMYDIANDVDVLSDVVSDVVSEGYTNKQRKALYDKINTLSSTEHEEILKIIKNNDITLSRNKNGIFFNLSCLSYDVIKEIDEFVMYCISNKKELDEYDKIINECKINNNISNMVPINTSLDLMGKKKEPKESWDSVKLDDESMDKFLKFVERVTHDKDKIGKKKINVKYNNAKKRYSKKISERKFESDLNDILQEEQYPLKDNLL